MNQGILKTPQERRLTPWPIFYLGALLLSHTALAGVEPACPHPAKVNGHFYAEAPDLFVMFKADADPYSAAKVLSEKYHLAVPSAWTHAPHGFSISNFDLSLIPLLQCEPFIDSLTFDEPITTGPPVRPHDS